MACSQKPRMLAVSGNTGVQDSGCPLAGLKLGTCSRPISEGTSFGLGDFQGLLLSKQLEELQQESEQQNDVAAKIFQSQETLVVYTHLK